jgi:hypothetical protein
MRSVSNLFITLLTLAVLTPVAAQQAQQFGDYEVHYSTLNTNMLAPDIASAYGIQRSGTQAILNITVLHKESGDAVRANVKAEAANLTGQRRDIELREIQDQGAIYYIGQFRIHNEESLNFDVSIRPEGREGNTFSLTFRKKFYTG